MITEKEKSEFGKQKAYGATSHNKPKNGKLVLLRVMGKEETLIEDKPFPFLNAEKTRLVRAGHFKAQQLKVRYL